MNKRSSFAKLAITTGDLDGIGLEIAAKALQKMGPQPRSLFFFFRSAEADGSYLKKLDRKFERIVVDDLAQGLDFFDLISKKKDLSSRILIDIASDDPPAKWVEDAATACLTQRLDGMITAPLSKTGIKDAGFQDLGHTDILKRISGAPFVHMGFLGQEFNVTLATAHIPIAQVPQKLNAQSLKTALLSANELRSYLPEALRKKPIGVLGLNPHAGERGLIGTEERDLWPGLEIYARSQGIKVVGPLVPDAAFLKQNWSRYSVFLALYHDQGLIPFKCVHGQQSGVHISLGLPFLRTSVDHGTARDIFGLNKANPNSMLDALRWALRLSTKKRKQRSR